MHAILLACIKAEQAQASSLVEQLHDDRQQQHLLRNDWRIPLNAPDSASAFWVQVCSTHSPLHDGSPAAAHQPYGVPWTCQQRQFPAPCGCQRRLRGPSHLTPQRESLSVAGPQQVWVRRPLQPWD